MEDVIFSSDLPMVPEFDSGNGDMVVVQPAVDYDSQTREQDDPLPF